MTDAERALAQRVSRRSRQVLAARRNLKEAERRLELAERELRTAVTELEIAAAPPVADQVTALSVGA